jgi:crotonobetainyl-CoA:carnitine CoA-transferase CaiB-like acyl-CoA transferase
MSAYGSTGADRDQPGFDGQIQARSGLAHMIGPADRPPTITSVPITDFLAAVEGAFAALVGLQRRNLTGEGQEVDVSMLDATSTLLGYLYADVTVFGHEPMRTGSRSPFALTGAFEANDGFVYLSPMGSAAWTKLFELIGRPEWGAPGSEYADVDVRLRDRDVIESAVTSWTRRFSRQRLQEILQGAGIASGPVNSVNEAMANPLLSDRGMIEEVALGGDHTRVPMPGTEVKVRGVHPPDTRVVPELGADTDAVLSGVGYTRAEIENLRAAGVVR